MATDEAPKLVAIVDDDELIRDALKGLMKEAGFSSLVFPSAEEFLNSGELVHTACLIATSECRECQAWNCNQN